MERKAPQYLSLIEHNFNDKDTDNLIEHFRDKDKRKEFFKEYKEIEMLYEIISPDKFLSPFIDDYKTLSSIYATVRNAYAKRVYVDREFQKKTNELVKNYVSTYEIKSVDEFIEINARTIEKIKEKKGNDNTKVINLIKSIEKIAEEESTDPNLIALSERAQAVRDRYEDRQLSTQEALAEIIRLCEEEEKRKKEQAEKGFDGLTFFIYRTLLDNKLANAEEITKTIKEAFVKNPNWRTSTNDLRELRRQVYYAIFEEEDDIDKAAALVDELFNLLSKAFDI